MTRKRLTRHEVVDAICNLVAIQECMGAGYGCRTGSMTGSRRRRLWRKLAVLWT
jgi:hypothetical protein